MRVPMVKRPCQSSRWETIRYALDSNPRTFRLCLIMIVLIMASAVATAIALRYGSGDVHGVTQVKSWFPASLR
jgi:N-acyl-L-homoserine lactone synthetase